MFLVIDMLLNGRLNLIILRVKLLKLINMSLVWSKKHFLINLTHLKELLIYFQSFKVLKLEWLFKTYWMRSMVMYLINIKKNLLRWNSYSSKVRKILLFLKICHLKLVKLLGLAQLWEELKLQLKNLKQKLINSRLELSKKLLQNTLVLLNN